VTQQDFANSDGTGAFSVRFAYDADGNRTSRIDPQGTTAYTLDALNRVVEEDPPGSEDFSFGFDAAGNLTSLADGSGTTTYDYDGLNQYVAMTEPGDATSTTFDYDANGQLTRTTYPGGVTLTRTYDASTGQLVGIVNRKPPAGTGSIFSEFGFGYSVGSDKGDVVQSMTASDGTDTNTTDYTYDALNRLTGAVTTGPTVNQYFEYAMDANGNRTSQVVNLSGSTSSGATTTSYAYNAGNELCWRYVGVSSYGCSSPPRGATTYSFNQAGEETSSRDGWAFSYDNAGQTTSITPAGGSAASQSYLGGGQEELVGNGSNVLTNSSEGVSSTTAGGATTYYGRTPDGTLVDERSGSSRAWYVFGYDVLGSVQGLVDGSTGDWVATRSYSPYGETVGSTGTDPNPFWYVGGNEVAAGLYHFGARYYDAAVGRWTQPDPLRQEADLQQGNQYLYSGDNPVNFSDLAGERGGPGTVCALRNGRVARHSCARETVAHLNHRGHSKPLSAKTIGEGLLCLGSWFFGPEAGALTCSGVVVSHLPG
jgi:RHS repeat-associated protein